MGCTRLDFAFVQTNSSFLFNDLKQNEMLFKNNLFSSEISEKKLKASQGIRYFNTDLKNIQKLRNEFHSWISSIIPLSQKQIPDINFTEYDYFAMKFEVKIFRVEGFAIVCSL